jgi:biopolymer transport protein ExbD
MKAGLTTSAIFLAGVLGFGPVALSAARAFEVADAEAFPIDVVPVQPIAQIQQRDNKLRLKEKPAQTSTMKSDTVPDARKPGDAAVDTDTLPITISVLRDGQIYLQETEIPFDELATELGAMTKGKYQQRIYVRADKMAEYGIVMGAITRIHAAGYTKIGLVTLQEQDQ